MHLGDLVAGARHDDEVAERQPLREVVGVVRRAAAVVPPDDQLDRQVRNLLRLVQQLRVADEERVGGVVREDLAVGHGAGVGLPNVRRLQLQGRVRAVARIHVEIHEAFSAQAPDPNQSCGPDARAAGGW